MNTKFQFASLDLSRPKSENWNF